MISATRSMQGSHPFLVTAARKSLEQSEARERLLIMNPDGTTVSIEHFDLFVGQEPRHMPARFVSIERPKDKVLIEKGILLTFFCMLLAFPVLSLLTLALIGLAWLKQETPANPVVIPVIPRG